MKILHTESAIGWAGQGIRVLNEAMGMRARGHEVWICCDPNSELASRCCAFGLLTYSLPMRRRSLITAFRIRRWIKTQGFEIINAHSSIDHWISAIAVLGLSKRPILIRTRHISSPLNKNILTRWLYRTGTDFFITAGEKLKDDLVKNAQLSANRIFSIPTGSDPRRFSPSANPIQIKNHLKVPTDKVVLGMVAKMRPWKGHKDLLMAVNQTGLAAGVSILFVGDGRLMSELKALAHSFELDCKFVGQVEDVAPFLQAMDIYCLPSHGVEGVPQAMTQAMLCGLPIIATDVGSVSEFVKSGTNGFLCSPGDTQQLTNSIIKLVSSKSLRRDMGKHSLDLASQTATLELMIGKTEMLMTDLVAPKKINRLC